jgi:hypothetical protein
VEELVKEGRVVAIVSAHPVPRCPGHIDGDDVGCRVVAALLTSSRPSTELARWDAEVGTETTCLTEHVERHRLRLARLDKCWPRFRQVGMPGHSAGVPVNGVAPRQERLSRRLHLDGAESFGVRIALGCPCAVGRPAGGHDR